MLKKLIILVFIFHFQSHFCQDQGKIEELKDSLNNTNDNNLKLLYLEKLWQNNTYDNEVEAISYAQEAVNLAKTINNDTLLGRAYERLGISYSNLSDYDNSNLYYAKALKLSIKLQLNSRSSGILINTGINYKSNGQLDSALYYLNKSKEFIDLSCCKKDSSVYASQLGTKADIYLSKSQFNLSLENAIKAAEIFKAIGDDIQYADQLMKVADANESLKNSSQAIEYLKESLAIYEANEDDYFACEACRYLGNAYSGSEPVQRDSASLYFNRAINKSKAIGVKSLEVMSRIDYADFLFKIKEYYAANRQLDKANTIGIIIKDTFGLSDIALLRGKILKAEANYIKAKSEIEKALALKLKMGLKSGVAEAYGLLGEISYNSNNYKEAYTYSNQFKILSDSIFNTERAAKFNELQIQFDVDKRKAELALKNQEIETLNAIAENDKLTKTIYGVGMFSFITISGLVFFGFKQRIKKNRIAREKQEAILNQKIEYKKKELATQTLHLVQKNTFIQELKDNLEKIKKSPELFKVEFRRLVMLLKKESAGDKDWKVFKSYFSEVHNNFDKKIKTISGDITEKEIRLASFLRMNLTTKEIASILNVLPDSVLKSKYRLKKKLGLSKDEDLNGFLNTI
jgi:tetratricopeptide (TPR) repeat protein